MSNIPKGYKQTEVGVIPEDWDATQISVLTSEVGDGIHSTPIYSNNGEYYFINGNNLVNGKIVTTQDTKRADFSEFKKYIKNLGDRTIFLSINGTIGNLALYYGEPIILGKSAAYLNVKKEISKRYIYFSLQTESVKQFFEDGLTGTTIKNLGLGTIRRTPIALPKDKKEQTAIASALSDADALIQSLKKLIAKKCNIKQGAMQELLKAKAGWVVKKLGDFLDYEQPTKYLVADTEYNDNNDTPVLTAGKTFILGYTNEDFGIYKDNLPVIIFDDFTTATKYVDFPFKAKSSAMKILRKKYETVNLRFIFEIMQRINFPLGDHKRHWIAEYQNIEISVPIADEQTRIATILSDMGAEISALEAKLAKYKQVKQGMMQELLTGRIRLLNIEASEKPKALVKAMHKKNDSQKKNHNWEFNEAVVISVLTKSFGSQDYPLGRKRYTKFSYLLHRYAERNAEGYLKKAAGPYNPSTKYGGPEKIAQTRGYIKAHSNNKYTGFIAANNVEEAAAYFNKWYGPETLRWLEQFRYKDNDELELLTTVDMAVQDLVQSNQDISVASVKALIHSHNEWRAKLKRPIFSDDNIDAAIRLSEDLFGT